MALARTLAFVHELVATSLFEGMPFVVQVLVGGTATFVVNMRMPAPCEVIMVLPKAML